MPSWLFFCIICICISLINAKVRFTNFVCTSLDEKFVVFEYCFLKSFNRTYSYASVKAKLIKKPVANVNVNCILFKRANGYKPFLYNLTFDVCKFLSSEKPNIVIKYLYDGFRSYSNLNHTCPYNHDILLDKINTQFLNEHVTKLLPFPKGDYKLESNWFFCNKMRANVRFFWTID